MRKMMMIGGALLIALAGCQTPLATGAGTGAAAGAIIGGIATGTVQGAATGAAIGAASGFFIGAVYDANNNQCYVVDRYGHQQYDSQGRPQLTPCR